MYFLDGTRLFIKPKKSEGSLNEQLEQCFDQLNSIKPGEKIYKLNFFADLQGVLPYNELHAVIQKKTAERFSGKLLLNLLAQAPLSCKLIIEVFTYKPQKWTSTFIEKGNDAAILFKREDSEILIGNIRSDQEASYRKNADTTFSRLNNFLNQTNFQLSSIVRQWNYLENIISLNGENQNYQEFNNARSAFYGTSFKQTGYPAATGIGTNSGGIIIEYVAVNSTQLKTFPIDNKEQIPAHVYSENVLIGRETEAKTTPKFERARYFELFGKKMIFISGTASILGEKTVGMDDPVEQTRITIENIQKLYSPTVLKSLSSGRLQAKYGHARVYIKNRKDFPVIKETFCSYFKNLPVVYIIADVCRNNLLVEIEGKVILE